MADRGGEFQRDLVNGVIDRGICVACGACVGLCPYFEYFDGRVAVMDRCSAGTGRCIHFCPRAEHEATNPEAHHSKDASSIGPVRRVLTAKASKRGRLVQYGGVVSALVSMGLKDGRFQAAVLTDRGGELSPGGVLVLDGAAVTECGGSRYSASASLSAFNKAVREGKKGLAVVGLPCQMEALTRMERFEGSEWASLIAMKIGLFCTWALDYRDLRQVLIKHGVELPVKRYDIPPPPSNKFVVTTGRGTTEIPLDAIRQAIKKGCSLCRDMTAEWADISVGTLEGNDKWNTVIIRTPEGERLFDEAVGGGLIKTGELAAANLKHLKEASENKRRRGMKARDEFLRRSDERAF